MTGRKSSPCWSCGATRSPELLWIQRANRHHPICARCKTAIADAPRPSRCPRKSGPGGQIGPRCRFFEAHEGPCLPTVTLAVGQLKQLREAYLHEHGVPA